MPRFGKALVLEFDKHLARAHVSKWHYCRIERNWAPLSWLWQRPRKPTSHNWGVEGMIGNTFETVEPPNRNFMGVTAMWTRWMPKKGQETWGNRMVCLCTLRISGQSVLQDEEAQGKQISSSSNGYWVSHIRLGCKIKDACVRLCHTWVSV